MICRNSIVFMEMETCLFHIGSLSTFFILSRIYKLEDKLLFLTVLVCFSSHLCANLFYRDNKNCWRKNEKKKKKIGLGGIWTRVILGWHPKNANHWITGARFLNIINVAWNSLFILSITHDWMDFTYPWVIFSFKIIKFLESTFPHLS
jgi:hypothetical protein